MTQIVALILENTMNIAIIALQWFGNPKEHHQPTNAHE
jgi:hypothetical protein